MFANAEFGPKTRVDHSDASRFIGTQAVLGRHSTTIVRLVGMWHVSVCVVVVLIVGVAGTLFSNECMPIAMPIDRNAGSAPASKSSLSVGQYSSRLV